MEQVATPELTEIIGFRRLLANVLRYITAGQNITAKAFDDVLIEVKKRKKAVALEAQ